MVLSQDFSVIPQTTVCVESSLLWYIVPAICSLCQLMLELRQVTMSDQHFSIAGKLLAQLIGNIGRWVFEVKLISSLPFQITGRFASGPIERLVVVGTFTLEDSVDEPFVGPLPRPCIMRSPIFEEFGLNPGKVPNLLVGS